jgi:hypothetical protein
VVARGVVEIGGKANDPNEVVTNLPVPLQIYLRNVLLMADGGMYPEMVLAFSKAVSSVGEQALREWLSDGSSDTAVTNSFAPWLFAE